MLRLPVRIARFVAALNDQYRRFDVLRASDGGDALGSEPADEAAPRLLGVFEGLGCVAHRSTIQEKCRPVGRSGKSAHKSVAQGAHADPATVTTSIPR
jgi:hypothetical protein